MVSHHGARSPQKDLSKSVPDQIQQRQKQAAQQTRGPSSTDHLLLRCNVQQRYTATTLVGRLIGLARIVLISITQWKYPSDKLPSAYSIFKGLSTLIKDSLYLKAIKGSIVFKSQDVIRDGEDVAMGSNQTPKVDGFRCWHEKRSTDKREAWFQIAFPFDRAPLCLHVMTECSAGIPWSSMARFFISHWTISAPGQGHWLDLPSSVNVNNLDKS